MAPHSSTLAWKIPWMEEPEGAAVHGVAKSWTRLSDFTLTFHFHALEKEIAPLQGSCLENPWWAAVYGVAQSWIQLKRLSSSSSSNSVRKQHITTASTQSLVLLKALLFSVCVSAT